MKQKDIIVLLAVAAGGYLLYDYLKKSGQWDQWFGSSEQPGTQPTTGDTTQPPVDSKPPANTVQPPVNSLRAELLAAAQGNAYLVAGRMNAHQWNYYRNILRPPALTGEQMNSAFPGAIADMQMTVDEFLAKTETAGLSAIVPSPVPSMSFSGSLGGPYGRKRGAWGGSIQ